MWYYLDSVPSTASQGQGEECLRISCSDTTSLELSRSRNTQGRFFSRDRRMEYCLGSRYGMMYALSEPIIRTLRRISKDSGESATISSSQGDSLVKMSLSQGRETVLAALAQAFTTSSRGSLARFDRDTCSLRTHRCLLSGDSREYSRDLPQWGMLADGELSELTTRVRLMSESGSGCGASGGKRERERHIPTPTVMDANGYNAPRRIMKEDNFRGVSLKYLVEQNPEKLWPTPTASDHKRVDATPEYSLKHAWSLPMAAKFNQPRGGMKGSVERMEACGLLPQHRRTPQEGPTAPCSGCSVTPQNQDARASRSSSPSTGRGDAI